MMKKKSFLVRNLGKIIIFLLIIGTAVFVGFYGGRISYTFFYCSLFLPLVSFLYTFFVYQSFKYIQDLATPVVVKGKPVEITIRLCNESPVSFTGFTTRFYKDRSYLIGVDENQEYHLSGNEKQQIQGMLCCKYRGEYHVGLRSIIIEDYFHIMRVKYKLRGSRSVTVFPRMKKWDHTNFISWDEDQKRNPFTSGMEEEPDAGVRAYREGDSLHRINWKATARSGELMTRLYQVSSKKKLVILLDLHEIDDNNNENALEQEDLMIEEMLSLAAYCVENKAECRVETLSYQCKKQEVRTFDDLNKMQQWGATASFSETGNFMELVQRSGVLLEEGTQFIGILRDLSPEYIGRLYEKRGQDTIMKLIYVGNESGPDFDRRIQYLETAGIGVLQIRCEGGDYGNES